MKTWQVVTHFKAIWNELDADPAPVDEDDIEVESYISEVKAGYLDSKGYEEDDYRVERMK